jgi:hypothetical protein
MKTHWVIAACMTAILVFAGSVVLAQDRTPTRPAGRPSGQNDRKLSQNRKRQTHIKLDDHDRQVIRDWYKPDRDQVLLGLRDPNGVAPYADSRLHIGPAADADLPVRRSAPIEFWHRLTSSPRNYQYVAIQGHVEAMDENYQDINDLIHLKLYF